ncbi:MAG: DUF4339 domain-containing protein [Verrucomicrobia subdivision 3 bacterium]|nr:DUF4339 domain-containing protein [Limisphaerales bacterium]
MSFLVSKDGQQLGPWTAEQMNAQLAGGMLEPSDLGWAEGFAEWIPLNQIDGLVMPGTQVAPATATVSMAAAPDAVPGLAITGEEATPKPRGRRMWVVAVVLLAVGGLGAYQFVFGQGDLASLCSVLVEIVVPEKVAVAPPKVVPPHVQKYQNAAQAAASGVAPIDEVNEQLDLRGEFHFTRNVSGLTIEAGDWMNQFSRDTTTTPAAKGIVSLARDALQKGGVSKLDALGMSSVFVKAGQFRHVAMVHHPKGSTNRLWSVLNNQGAALDGLCLMSADTVLAVHGRVNVSEMSQWFSELGVAEPLTDAWQSLKIEVPMDVLLKSWTGEAGLFLSVNNTKFRASDGKTELGKPGLLLVLGVKDGALGKVLGEQLKDLQEPARTAKIKNVDVPLRVYEKLELPEEIEKLDLVPSICQSGNYLVLALSFSETAASSALVRNATGKMGGTTHWAGLLGQNPTRLTVPLSNFVFYLSPTYRTELAKWQKLALWQDVPPSLQSALAALAGSQGSGGLLATVDVRGNGVLFKGNVNGQTASQSFARVKTVTRIFVAELVPQLAKLAHGQWSKLDMPTKPKPTPAPEPPESSGE